MKDLNLLYVFEALWRDRSVSGAAVRLGVSQAAVSSSLKRLRVAYQDKLFVLVSRRMEPTPFAESLSDPLLDALAAVRGTNQARATFDATASSRTFTIRTRDIGEVVCLPPVFRRLSIEAPGIRLRTVHGSVEEALTGLAGGSIDMALGFLPKVESGIHSKAVLKEEYVCAMRKGHPLASKSLTRENFAAQNHLLVEYAGIGYQNIERVLTKLGGRTRIMVRLPQYLAAPHFVVDSDLLWILPKFLARNLSVYFPLEVRPLPIEVPSFDVSLYWHERFHRDPANVWLRNFIAQQVALEQRNSKAATASRSRPRSG